MKKPGSLPFLAFIASLGGFLFGYDTGVISGTVGFVRDQFSLTPFSEGWFISSALAGCLAGVSFAGYLADRWGRRSAILLSALLFLTSAIGCMLVGQHSTLIMYRIVGGIGVGIASMVAPLYISEIAPANIRGRLVAFYQFSIILGILASYLVNAGLLELSTSSSWNPDGWLRLVIKDEVWRGMFGSESAPALLYFALAIFLPETQRWREVKATGASTTERKGSSFRQLIKGGFGMALFLGISLAVLQQLSGINAVLYYGPQILEKAGFSISGALGGQVIIGVVNVLFTILAIWKVDQWGRRKMMLFGVISVGITHLVIGTLFATGTTQGGLMLSMIMLFTASFSFSYGPVVWIYLSEIFPTPIRGRAIGLATFFLWTTNAILGQLVPWLLQTYNPALTFWIFALFCIPALYIVVRLMPETKGKTLEEIEHFWISRRGKPRNNNR